MGHFARECRAPRSQDRGRRDNYKQGSKVEEQAPKALMASDGVGWDWSYMANDEENHALVAEKEAPIKFAFMANTSAESKIYSSPKKDLSWTGLPEFKDDTVTSYSRAAPTVESSPEDAQNRNPSVTETEASPTAISPNGSYMTHVESIMNKMHKAFPLPVIEFPLPEEIPTASEESSHCLKKREATAVKISLLLKSRRNCQSKSDDSYTKDSYEVPASAASTTTTDTASDGTGKKKGMTVTVTTEDMQKRKNDATKKTKKNLLKQQYGNFKVEGSETLEQTFNRLQVIISQLQFIDIEIKQNDLNQKFLTSLAPEWLMYTIVWRNMSDLDTMSLDDLYNHLKVYESEVQKKSELNPQNMAFISLAKHSRGNKDVNTASVSTASTSVPTASANTGVASISQDTACAYIASQSSGKKISMQGTDMAGFDKSKVECFNCHKMGHFARECRAPRSQDRGRRDNYRQGSKVEEHAPKALMAINEVGWDWSYMANDEENHALVADKEAPTEFALMANTSAERLAQVESRLVEHKDREIKYCEKIRGLELEVEFKTNSLECLAKELETLKKEKEGLDGKLDIFWTGLSKFKDDTVTDYSRPAPTVEGSPNDAQNRNPFVTEEASPNTISPKSFIKFVKANDSPTTSKTDKAKTAKKPLVKSKLCDEEKCMLKCGDFNHLAYDCRKRVKKGTYRSQNNTHKSFTPRPAAHKPYRPPMRPMRSNMNGARLNRTTFNKQAHLYANIPFHRTSAVRSHYRALWVPTVNRNFSPVDRKFSTGGCKITGKGTIKTGKLEFENVYFVKDLKYNLFSVSQICNNKNSVLFTDSECIVLGRDFKLLDDANILLRTPRQHNMYSIDLNNIVLHRYLTCLVAKASADECMLWHMRLGHLSFKTMNKLVRHNLVRGLPTKCFKNDHTCTACLKGKQHKASFKRIFRYLKGHLKLGLWYPKESPFDLVAYLDSNYGGATQDHKSTTEGCQFLGR
nr:ribonuclease H-like domain-containing protein [Tanacetum cinerariifolium]